LRHDVVVRHRVAALLLLALAAGCVRGDGNGDGGSLADPGSTTTVIAAPTTTPAPTVPPPPPAPACPTVPAPAQPSPDRPRYLLGVDVRLDENLVAGTLQVRFVPDLDTDRLVFRLWPNGPRPAAAGARIETGPVLVGGRPAAAVQEDPTTLVVGRGGLFPAGRPVDVSMTWTLHLPGSNRDRIAREGDAVRLGSFFPILAWEPGAGWATDPPTAGFAEASTAPVADFDVSITVPPGYEALASGQPEGPNRWRGTAMRDVALSVGRFAKAEAVANAPGPVRVTVGVHAGVAEAPEPYLDKVVRSLEDFAVRFGPYPWPTFTLAITPNLNGGIEYPTHVMQGPGTLARTTSHEVAHQWFYGLVGNNQGRDPWLDEGLATWAEGRFEGTMAEFVATPVPVAARNRVAEPMTYWADLATVYYTGVYVQGAQALAALGDYDLVDCALRVFVAVNAHGIARPADLVAAARSVFPDAAAVLAGYGITP
jgi:hypothetical protein